jgi:chromate transporter
VLAGGTGLLLFHSKKVGAVVLGVCIIGLGVLHSGEWSPSMPLVAVPQGTLHATSVLDIGTFFFTVGMLTFGGGLTMIAFIHDQVVNQLHWLTPQEFLDGLALGQLTPGPILMVAAYVGYKVAGGAGAMVGAAAIFLPSFLLMLTILPVFDRVRTLVWTRAALQGIGPAVIGVLAVSLVQLAPHALPDPLAIAMLIATVIALFVWRIGVVKLILAGAGCGILRSRLLSLPGVKAALALFL